MNPEAWARRTAAVGALVLATGIPTRHLQAQSPEPELVFSASGGFTFERSLWATRQLVAVPTSGSLLMDTFLLSRALASGWSAWAGVTRYVPGGIGWGAELGWAAVGSRTGCAIAGTPQPDPSELNLLACGRIPHESETTSALALLATATWRVWPRRDVSPFVKAGAGFALLGGSFTGVRTKATTTACSDCVRIILADRQPVLAWSATIAAGLAIGGASPQRIRIEVRDFILGLPVVTGPADPVAVDPIPRTRVRAVHRFTLGIGIDLVVGGRHRRRY